MLFLRNKKTICIITSGQPSTNPRAVKEADALCQMGYRVRVIASHWIDWAIPFDRLLLADRPWEYQLVGYQPKRDRFRYFFTRLRHKLARILSRKYFGDPWIEWAAGRTVSELKKAAQSFPADLYIAHTIPALPAADCASKKYDGKFAFDAEDFHSGQLHQSRDRTAQRICEHIEKKYLPRCHYVSASSPLIGEAYGRIIEGLRPKVVLNVFPLRLRPKAPVFNPSSDPLKLFWFSQTIGESRGLEDVVSAMACFPHSKIECHLLGNVKASYKEKFYSEALKAGLQQSQIFFYEPIHPDGLVEFASRFDVGLALESSLDTNYNLALTNKFFTYLLAGCAVVGTSTLAQRPLVESLGEAGWLVAPGDVHQLATGLRNWLEDREGLKRARQKAWEIAEKQYNWDLEKFKFLRLVEETLS